MAYQLVFTPEAKLDVKNAASYYDDKLQGLGKRFKEAVKTQLIALKQNPHTHSTRYDTVRLAIINRFPYSIHYTIHRKNIVIHAIICDYRDPTAYWHKSTDQ